MHSQAKDYLKKKFYRRLSIEHKNFCKNYSFFERKNFNYRIILPKKTF